MIAQKFLMPNIPRLEIVKPPACGNGARDTAVCPQDSAQEASTPARVRIASHIRARGACMNHGYDHAARSGWPF